MPVDIDWDVIEGVEDLDKPFKKALARAEDDAEPGIRLEWAEAKSQFYERRAAKAELTAAKMSALEKYPLAKDFAEDIRGSSAQEIEASAKRFHDRIEKMQGEQAAAKQKAADDEAAQRAAAQAAYGSPVAAGGGTPIPPAVEDIEAVKQRTWQRLGKGMGMQDSQSKLDFPRFASVRLREGVEAAASPNARYKNPGNDKKVGDDRRR
jgi:hypothetical protein